MLRDWSKRARQEGELQHSFAGGAARCRWWKTHAFLSYLFVLTVGCRRQSDGQEQQDGDRQTSHGVEGRSWLGVRGLNLTAWLSASIFSGGFTVRWRAFVCLHMWRALVSCGHGTITPTPTPQLSNHYIFLSNVWAHRQVVEASYIFIFLYFKVSCSLPRTQQPL